jgi:hypothetical protein
MGSFLRHARHPRSLSSWLLVSAVLLTGAPAPAQTEDAKKSFDEGQEAFLARRFGEAAEAFERSARATPHPASLVNAAEAWQLDGNLVRAARACDWALRLPMQPTLKTAIELRLRGLVRSIGTLSFQGGEGVSGNLDGTPVHPPEVVRVSHGHHRLVIVDLRRHAERALDLDIAMGETREITLAPPSDAPPAPAEPPAAKPPTSSPSGPPAAAWVAFATAGVGLAATTTFGLLTLGARSRFNDAPTRDNADSFYRDRALTNVSMVVTALGAATGAALWILWPKAPANAALGLGATTATLRMTWQ